MRNHVLFSFLKSLHLCHLFLLISSMIVHDLVFTCLLDAFINAVWVTHRELDVSFSDKDFSNNNLSLGDKLLDLGVESSAFTLICEQAASDDFVRCFIINSGLAIVGELLPIKEEFIFHILFKGDDATVTLGLTDIHGTSFTNAV